MAKCAFHLIALLASMVHHAAGETVVSDELHAGSIRLNNKVLTRQGSPPTAPFTYAAPHNVFFPLPPDNTRASIERPLFAAEFSSTGDGTTDDTAKLQAIFNGVPRKGAVVLLDGNRYAITATLFVRSNTTIICTRRATLVAGVEWTGNQRLLSNANRDANTPTDHDITVAGCAFDLTNLNSGGSHAINIRMAQHVRILRPTCVNGGDCVAFLATRDTVVVEGHATGMKNACWDSWEASSDGQIIGGYCDSGWYGALVTGTDTGSGSAGVANRHVIIGGTYNITAGGQAGIWINGLGAPGSGASNVKILAPSITMASGTVDCIKVSGAGIDNQIIAPSCSGPANQAIASSADAGGTPSNTMVQDALIDGVGNGLQPLIQMDGAGDSVVGVKVAGGTYTYGLKLAGAGQFVAYNDIPAGSSGGYSLSGATNYKVINRISRCCGR